MNRPASNTDALSRYSLASPAIRAAAPTTIAAFRTPWPGSGAMELPEPTSGALREPDLDWVILDFTAPAGPHAAGRKKRISTQGRSDGAVGGSPRKSTLPWAGSATRQRGSKRRDRPGIARKQSRCRNGSSQFLSQSPQTRRRLLRLGLFRPTMATIRMVH